LKWIFELKRLLSDKQHKPHHRQNRFGESCPWSATMRLSEADPQLPVDRLW
jgi:hypothetical protein